MRSNIELILKVVSSNLSRSDIIEMPCSWNDFFISVRKLPIIELMDLNFFVNRPLDRSTVAVPDGKELDLFEESNLFG